MAVRNVIVIDESRCDGCGQCATACAEGAIAIIGGKAKLVSEVYCDGLGACLGECPQAAIKLVAREAKDFDEGAVKALLGSKAGHAHPGHGGHPHAHAQHHGGHAGHKHDADQPCGCPGSAVQNFGDSAESSSPVASGPRISRLGQWPIQLMLVPPSAPFLQGREIVLCADCVPFAVPDFHERYLNNRAVLVGCPKLDDVEFYGEKLKEILKEAAPYRLTVLRMEVPCCGGLARVALAARDAAAPDLPVEIHTIAIKGGKATVDISVKAGKAG